MAVASKVPDCFQRTPRRINIPTDNGNQILTLTIDGQGILIYSFIDIILFHIKLYFILRCTCHCKKWFKNQLY